MAYKLLEKTPSKPVQKPAVTITKDTIRFNKAAIAEHELEGFTHAELHQDDEDTTKYMVKLLKANAPHANKMRKGVLSAMAWINTHSVPPGVYDVKAGVDGDSIEFVASAA